MPNRAIEIHDSILSAVSFLEREVKLHFSPAYIHQSEGIPLRDAGSGWVQDAMLHIYDAKVEGTFAEFPVDLTDGRIQRFKWERTFWKTKSPCPCTMREQLNCDCKQSGRENESLYSLVAVLNSN